MRLPDLKKAILPLLLLALLSCHMRRPEGGPERCIPLSRLPQELSLAFGGPDALSGAYSLRAEGREGVAVFRGRFLFLRGQGLWAEGRDPWGRLAFQFWADHGGLWLLEPAQRALLHAPWGDRPICLSLGPRDPEGRPLWLLGRIGPYALRVTLRELRAAEGQELPLPDPSRFEGVLEVRDPLEFLVR